jgi:nitrogen-specific signal transduction histidine kinase/CheY-like chemotaxis protein
LSTRKTEHKVLFLGFSQSDNERIEKVFDEKRPGLSIVFAVSNEEGLIFVKKGSITAIFINQTADSINSFALLKNVQAMDRHIPTVLLTASQDKEANLNAFEKGIYECLAMEENYPELLPAALDRARARHKYRKASKAKEWAISQSRKEWITIIDAITDFIFITDDQCRLIKMNWAFSHVFGGGHPRSLIGSTCVAIFGDESPCNDCHINNILEHTTHTSEKKVNGNIYQFSTFPLYIDEKPFTVHVMKDITEMRMLKDQLYYADKLASLGSLVAGVAHEINNPLTGVIAYAELLRMRPSTGEIDDELKKILHNAERCKKIVENLLTFSRQKAPTKSIESLNDIIDRSIDLRTYWLRSANIEIMREYSEGLTVYVDAQQMQLVFLNILMNAEQAINGTGRGKGKIVISTKYDKETKMATIRFFDNGPGIPRDVIPKIFDPFFTTKPVGIGTGLGLAISHGIVTEHGGSIKAESSEGQGTSLIIEFPTGAGMVSV